jgi:hypothetical protein
MWGFLAYTKHSLGEWKVLKRQAPPFLRNARKGIIHYTLIRAAGVTSLKA